jgi:hypothetical protein
MKAKYASILLTLLCVLGLSVTTKAQIRDRVVVTMPFAFTVDGQTFPAGKYILSSYSTNRFNGLILSNLENHTSVIVHPVEVEGANAEKVGVSFEQVGEQHVLSQIQTSEAVYNFKVVRSVVMEAAVSPRNSTSDSVNSGSH